MTDSTLLTIGAFARLVQVSTATVRHYDRVGVLTPAVLDPDTGYRYYTLAQVPRLNRIVALRELGFPLPQIAVLLADDLSTEQLRRRCAHQQRVVAAEQARLTRVAARLQQIEQAGHLPNYTIRLKHTDTLLVASIRDRVPHLTQRGPLERELATYLERQGLVRQPYVVLVHSRHAVLHGAVSIDVEVGVVVPAPLPMSARVQLRQLPRALVASTVHIGTEQALHAAYVALLRWLDASGQPLVGSPRQVQLAANLDGDPHARVTEMQFPIPMSAADGEPCRRAENV